MTDKPLDLAAIEKRCQNLFNMFTHPYGDEQCRLDCLALVAEVKRLKGERDSATEEAEIWRAIRVILPTLVRQNKAEWAALVYDGEYWRFQVPTGLFVRRFLPGHEIGTALEQPLRELGEAHHAVTEE